MELQGFKSFCDRTELRFHGTGIAAIVGPNGCGKSNLSDAVSWVLGEQSAKSLRGTRMEDVIFAGTRDRKPVGMATVTLTLVDPSAAEASRLRSGANGDSDGDGQAPERPAEITITRRLFRSGDSEYLINGRPARLRDIQELFMGTGLGPECYAIIEQGRIGQILSSRPQDRRAVIEEAAGITKFKTKRRLAEAKLEAARQNLTRVFDILEEVSRQMNSLKRQAAKARRYEELKAEWMGQLRRLLATRYSLLEREAARIALDLNLANAQLQRVSGQLAEQEAEYAQLQSRGYQAEDASTASRQRLADWELEAERTRGRRESQAQQAASLEERLAQAQRESGELGERNVALAQELEECRRRVAEVEQLAAGLRSRLEAKASERAHLQRAVADLQQAIETARQRVLALLGESSALRNQLAQLEEYLAGLERDEARLRKEEESALLEWERLQRAQAEVSEKLAARQMTLRALVEERVRTEEQLAARKAAAAQLRSRLEALRSEVSRLRARRDSLAEILGHRAYTTEAVKGLFQAVADGRAGQFQPLGVLADFLEVEPAYEQAAEAFLREELEYVVVSDWPQARLGVQLLSTQLEGRATFVVYGEDDSRLTHSRREPLGGEPPIGPETGIAGRLQDVVRLVNGLGRHPAELLPRLARCFLAEDAASAQRLAGQYPELYFLLPDGACYHGRAVSGGRKLSSGPLSLKRQLRELQALAAARAQDLDRGEADLAKLEEEIAGLERDLEQVRNAQQGQEKESLGLEHELRKLAEELSRCGSRLSVARLELDRVRKSADQASRQGGQWREEIAAKERARQQQEEALSEMRRQLADCEARAARAGEEHAALRAELAGLEERARANESALRRLEAQRAENDRRRQDLEAEMERLAAERARLLDANVALDQRLAQLEDEIGKARGEAEQWAARSAEIRSQLAALDEQLRRLRLEAQAVQEKRAASETELVRLQTELRFLEETCRRDLGAAIQDIVAGQESLPSLEELAEIEAKHQELRERMEALEPVNPQALEEYEETRQRYDFLNAQRQDLLDSIRDTEKAIREIDAETRRRFTEAFDAINAHFRETFRALFGGGVGEMRLTDETNAAESGIDIVASPPGKRLQNVLLLSGGEKALTALALLLAIFKYQPSPFCILDEVDAPLDEPNIGRLMRLLREMSHQTQFVLITHAKRTMEAAETLYGVTMEEPGVSKIVSVRFGTPGRVEQPAWAEAQA
ncbi:MAG: chromosome segregation protein SMC [Bryobacteraceae bacterium]|nr:chromosome segregation protein SMC [Bryobacteraceae bacterium]